MAIERSETWCNAFTSHSITVSMTDVQLSISRLLKSRLITVPVNSVNAHNEGLYIRVGGAAELAAGLSAERGAIT